MTRSLRPRKTRTLSAEDNASNSGDEPVPKPLRKRTKRTKDADGDYDHVYDKALPSEVSSSKSSAKGKVKKGRVGKLAQLPKMPLDILFEIFALLPPLDLLRLTRTSKSLRRLLMSRESRPTWIAALATVPASPTIPDDMTEPAWVHLAFETSCHTCDAKNVKNVLWAARVRSCTKCFDDHPDLLSLDSIIMDPAYIPVLNDSLILWESGSGKRRSDRFAQFTQRKAVQDMLDTLKALPAGSSERLAYVTERQEKKREREKHARQCKEWDKNRVHERSDTLVAARQRRKDAIQARLVAMDPEYEEDLTWLKSLEWNCWEFRNKFEELKSVKQPKDLTDRIWTNCKPEVMGFLATVRPMRKADEWLKVLKDRATLLSGLLVKHCPPEVVVPCVMDLYTRLDIRAILERPLDDNGQDTVDGEAFTDILADFDPILAHARAERSSTLLSALRTESDTPNTITTADLDRPTSVFRCTSGGCTASVMNGAMALVHRCDLHRWHHLQHQRTSMTEWRITDPMERMRYVCKSIQGCGGSATFELELQAMAWAMKVMELAEVDPVKTTVEDLDDLDPWFSCSCHSCSIYNPGFHATMRVHDWRHIVGHHHFRHTEKFAILGQEQRSEARAQRDAYVPVLEQYTTSAIWACTHCALSPVSNTVLKKHLQEFHGLQGEPVLDVDIKPSAHCLAPAAGEYMIRNKVPTASQFDDEVMEAAAELMEVYDIDEDEAQALMTLGMVFSLVQN